MSADKINAVKELNVWVVHGSNFQVNVPLDEFNCQFDLETQAYEAATIALQVFKGRRSDLLLKLDDGEKAPELGTTMIVHLKDTDPNKGFLPLTHVVLANDGYYKESIKVQQVFNQQLAAIQQEYQKMEEAKKVLNNNPQVKVKAVVKNKSKKKKNK